MDLTPLEREKLHGFYLATRELLASGVVTHAAAQRSFEEMMAGFLRDRTWRCTHISPAAARDIAAGRHRNVQRAHGIGGRLDRYDRTVKLLTSDVQDFDAWWSFYLEHDATVLITREEHNRNVDFDLQALVTVPEGLFPSSGFSYKVRKKMEVAWLTNQFKPSLVLEPGD